MIRIALANVLTVPPLARPIIAPLIGAAALGAPTALLSFDHALPAGACCTIYFPFVLLSVLLIGPVYASAVAIGSTGLADALFMGPRYQLFESPMDTFGDIASLSSSALIIGLVILVRRAFAERSRQVPLSSPSGLIFSREQGKVWASWHGNGPPVCLGPEKRVAAMMEDYLAQVCVAARLGQSDILLDK
jgi:hypothetical protein